MGIWIPKGTHFLGVPLITVRNVLKAWRYGGSTDAAQIANLSNVDLDVRTVMALLDELRDRGLIGEEMGDGDTARDGLTEKGHALAIASARARTPKAAAWRRFEEFLTSCAAINARSELPFYVKEVWLFGSMIDPARTNVGDIDFVIETRGKSGREESSKVYERLAKELGLKADSSTVFRMPRFAVEKHLLYGPLQHPLFKPSPLNDLVALACPCELVFTHTHGRLHGPILDKHPDATEKSKTIRGRVSLEGMFSERRGINPLPADLIQPRSLNHKYKVLRAIGPWPDGDERYRLVQSKMYQCHPLISPILPAGMVANVVTKKLDISDCNARRRSGLVVTETLYIEPGTTKCIPMWRAHMKDDRYYFWKTKERATYASIVERSIEEKPERVTYSMSVSSEVFKHSAPDYGDFCATHYWFHVLATADIERIQRRDAEAGITRPIVVTVTNPKRVKVASQEDMTNDLAIELASSLSNFVDSTREVATA